MVLTVIWEHTASFFHIGATEIPDCSSSSSGAAASGERVNSITAAGRAVRASLSGTVVRVLIHLVFTLMP